MSNPRRCLVQLLDCRITGDGGGDARGLASGELRHLFSAPCLAADCRTGVGGGSSTARLGPSGSVSQAAKTATSFAESL